MGRSPYQSEKRRKELARMKKQEEKRQRRFNKKHEGETAGQTDETLPGETPSPDGQPADGVQPDAPPTSDQAPETP